MCVFFFILILLFLLLFCGVVVTRVVVYVGNMRVAVFSAVGNAGAGFFVRCYVVVVVAIVGGAGVDVVVV